MIASILNACVHTTPDSKSSQSKRVPANSRSNCGDLVIEANLRYFHIINADLANGDRPGPLVILNQAPNFFDVEFTSKETSLDESGCLVVDGTWLKAHILDHQRHMGKNLDLESFKPGVIHSIQLESIPAQQDPMHYVACGILKDFDKFVPGQDTIIDLFDAKGKGIPAHQVSAALIRKVKSQRLTISEGGCILLSGKYHGTILYSDQKTFVLEFIYRGPNPSGDPYFRMLGSPSKRTIKDFAAILRKL
jgi:hypothetical protein